MVPQVFTLILGRKSMKLTGKRWKRETLCCWGLTLRKVREMFTVLDTNTSSLLLTPHDPETVVPLGSKFISSYFCGREKRGWIKPATRLQEMICRSRFDIIILLMVYVRLLASSWSAGQNWLADTLCCYHQAWGCTSQWWGRAGWGSVWWSVWWSVWSSVWSSVWWWCEWLGQRWRVHQQHKR